MNFHNANQKDSWKSTQRGLGGGAVCCLCYLEGVFVDEDVQSSLHLLGFTEEDELLKEEDVTLTLPPPRPDSELVLTDQLTLLLQVHLGGGGGGKCQTAADCCMCSDW